jgi:hypothetical protein
MMSCKGSALRWKGHPEQRGMAAAKPGRAAQTPAE